MAPCSEKVSPHSAFLLTAASPVSLGSGGWISIKITEIKTFQ